MMNISLTYDDFSMESLCDAITNPSCVRSLDLSANNISSDTMVTIVERFISQMVYLEELDLKGNKIGSHGTKILCNALRKHCKKLRYLDLSENGILDESLLEVAYLLQDTSLTSLFLVSNHLTTRGVATLCDGVASTNCIHHLNLAYNAFGDEGAASIAEALGHHPSLRSLDLSDNEIGDSGAVAIATHIIMSPDSHLEVLNLSVNRVKDVGFVAIGDALAQTTNPRLAKLDLGCIGSVGASGREAFIKHVGFMRHLRFVDLCSINLSDEDARNLITAVSSKTCGITEIEWYNNPQMSLEAEKALFTVLEAKREARVMDEKKRRQRKYFACAAFFVAAVATAVALTSRRVRR